LQIIGRPKIKHSTTISALYSTLRVPRSLDPRISNFLIHHLLTSVDANRNARQVFNAPAFLWRLRLSASTLVYRTRTNREGHVNVSDQKSVSPAQCAEARAPASLLTAAQLQSQNLDGSLHSKPNGYHIHMAPGGRFLVLVPCSLQQPQTPGPKSLTHDRGDPYLSSLNTGQTASETTWIIGRLELLVANLPALNQTGIHTFCLSVVFHLDLSLTILPLYFGTHHIARLQQSLA